MVKLWTTSLKLFPLIILGACSKDHLWYQREFSEEEKPLYAEHLQRGSGYHYQGSPASDFHLLEALELDPNNGDIWREMGTPRVKRGIADEMQYFYGKAVNLKPDPWAGFRGYLYLYFYRDYERAIADFNLQDSIIGMVGNSQAQDHDYMRGIAYYGLKDYQKAQDFLSRYINRISADPGPEWVDVYAHLYRALAWEKLDQKDQALAELNQVLQLFPQLADGHYHKARLLMENNQKSEAQKEMEVARKAFAEGFYHHRPYVEVLEQIYEEDLGSNYKSDLLEF